MPEFTFEGLDELRNTADKLHEIALTAAVPAMNEAVLYLHGRLPGYPQLAGTLDASGSSYDWTGTLGRSFTTKTTQEDEKTVGLMGTNLWYAPWVVGPDFPGEVINGQQMYQASMHVDRWWQFAEEVEENMPEAWKVFDEEFAKEYQKQVRKELGG